MTVLDIITRFRKRFGDCSASAALDLLNDSAREILYTIPYAKTSIDVPLVANTAEYALAADYLRVWSGRYLRSANAGDFRELKETSEDQLDLDRPGWRALEPDEPLAYYIDSNESVGGVVGFFPTPNATSSVGYPKVILEVSKFTPYVADSDLLPVSPLVVNAFVDLMCYKRALDTKVQDAVAWKQISEDSLQRASEMFWGRSSRMHPTIQPTIRQRRGWRNSV
jgi:hypothetical protein